VRERRMREMKKEDIRQNPQPASGILT